MFKLTDSLELIQEIEEKVFNFSDGVRIEVKGKLNFQES